MRKIKIFSLIFVLIIGLCSCSAGSAEFNVETLKYEFDKEYIPQLKITLLGEKVYGKDSGGIAYDVIDYKLYDSEGYSIDSGRVFLDSLREGEKFKDSSIVIYDIMPGETYEL